MKLLLASGSKTRAEILDKAKIPYEVVEHNVDEDEAKISYAHLTPEDIATKLAELKAIKPSYQYENSFVIGADQVLELNDTIINKAKGQLLELQGKNHKLITSIAIAKKGSIVWKHRDTSNISMRELNEKQIDNYLNNIDKSILSCVGVYAIEQDGIKLLNKIDGDYFSILGLPLLPLTQFLWQNNILLNE